MKETPILMKPEMIRAILAGQKTQTRRLIKFKKPREDCVWCYGKGFEYIDCQNEHSGYDYRRPCRCCWPKCPYGRKGDLLWVREAFWNSRGDDSMPTYYRADQDTLLPIDHNYWSGPWRPSIHMPKWACRLRLELTADPIPQRLQDIMEEDAAAEGVEPASCCFAYYHGFAKYWDSINGPGTWEKNPWVWKLKFKRVTK